MRKVKRNVLITTLCLATAATTFAAMQTMEKQPISAHAAIATELKGTSAGLTSELADDALASFEVYGASIRAVAPTGMRCLTILNSTDLAKLPTENIKFGTLILPVDMLDENELLTHNTTSVLVGEAKVASTAKEIPDGGLGYYVTLVGNSASEAFPETLYGESFALRSYVEYTYTPDGGEPVTDIIYSKQITRSLGEVASKALLDPEFTGDTTFLNTIVSKVTADTTVSISDKLFIDEAESKPVANGTITVNNNTANCVYTLAVEDENVAKIVDGELVPVAEGTTKVTATIGDTVIESNNVSVWYENHEGYYAIKTADQLANLTKMTKNYFLLNDITFDMDLADGDKYTADEKLANTQALFKNKGNTLANFADEGTGMPSDANYLSNTVISYLTEGTTFDGNGKTLSYSAYCVNSGRTAFFGMVRGTIKNLDVVGRIRNAVDVAWFAYSVESKAVIDNCNFDITLTGNQNVTGTSSCDVNIWQSGLMRHSGLMKNSTLIVREPDPTYTKGAILLGWRTVFKDPSTSEAVGTYENVTVYAENILPTADINKYTEGHHTVFTRGLSGTGEMYVDYEGVTVQRYIPIYTAQNLIDLPAVLTGKYVLMNDITFDMTYAEMANQAASEALFSTAQAEATWVYSLLGMLSQGGVFDGNGKTISYSLFTSQDRNSALFTRIDGTVQNLNVVAKVRATANNYMLAYQVRSTGVINNCTFDYTLTSNSTAPSNIQYKFAFARMAGTMNNCTVIVRDENANQTAGATLLGYENALNDDGTKQAMGTFNNVTVYADNMATANTSGDYAGLGHYLTFEWTDTGYLFSVAVDGVTVKSLSELPA